MKKALIVIDMQNDFIDGTLGTEEAQKIIEKSAEKIRGFQGDIYGTLDTHGPDYLSTQEGRKLPVTHCIYGEDGWALHGDILQALADTEAEVHDFCRKGAFGSAELSEMLGEIYKEEDVSIECIGLCTDICVISNALMLKSVLPEAAITVDAACCAGVTPESHQTALNAMKMCQIEIINE